MDSVYALKTAAENNNAASPDGFPENMQFSGVNDSFRELMAVLKRDYLDRGGSIATTSNAAGDFSFSENQTLASPPVQGTTLAFKANTDSVTALEFEGRPVVTDRGGRVLRSSLLEDSVHVVVYNAAYDAWQLLTQLPSSLTREQRQSTSDVNLVRRDLNGIVQVSIESGVKAPRVLTVTSDLDGVWPVGAFIEFVDVEDNTGGAKATGTHVALPAGSTYRRFLTIRSLGTTTVDSPKDASGNAIVVGRGLGARIAKLYRTGPAAFTAVQRPVP